MLVKSATMSLLVIWCLTGSFLVAQGAPIGVADEACSDKPAEIRHFKTLFGLSQPLNQEFVPASIDFGKVALGEVELDSALRTELLGMARTVTERSVPRPIIKGAIGTAPALASTPSGTQSTPPPWPELNQAEQDRVVLRGQSVGRLEVVDSGRLQQLGTAFVIADGVIATNCHVVAPIVSEIDGKWSIDPQYVGKVTVDFIDGKLDAKNPQFEITGMLAYSKQIGFDIVLLGVKKKASDGLSDLPPFLRLAAKEPQLQNTKAIKSFALIGYPDIERSIDPFMSRTYGRYKGTAQEGGKFVVVGGLTATDKCRPPLTVLLNTASTTGGQSGSVLLDRVSGEVIGIHNCCAVYDPEQSSPPPPAEFACGTIRDTYSNQAISSASILNAPELSKILKTHGVGPEASHKGAPEQKGEKK